MLIYESCGGFCTAPPADDKELEDDGGSMLDLLDVELRELDDAEDLDELEDDDLPDADDAELLAELLTDDATPDTGDTAMLENDPVPLADGLDEPEGDEAPEVEDDTEDGECGGVGIVGVMFALGKRRPSRDKMLS